MLKLVAALGISVLLPTLAAASEKEDVMAVVTHWTGVFNSGHTYAPLSACAEETYIIDDIAPFVWHGPKACAEWLADFDAYLKNSEITDAVCTVLAPWHTEIAADRAYVVIPVDFAYRQSGKPTTATGSVLTMVLRKGAAGWRITAWALAGH